ncbi:MAG: D-alanine--D-alanine ligase [Chitinophagales bacterium]|nr:D-alanine--D-alanine ligase [Chitinophagales bacterium]
MKKKTRLPEFFKWEFWPFWIFYLPVYFHFIVLAFRARTLSFFTLTNPGMVMGGFAGYSKSEIQNQLHKKYIPETLVFTSFPDAEEIIKKMKEAGIYFPVILKPDFGERGWKVEKISDRQQMEKYLMDVPEVFLLQEYINLPEEYGVMYYRLPSNSAGTISSLMKRDFLSVTGNGKSTLLELFQKSDRCRYHLEKLIVQFKSELQAVIAAGEKKTLIEIGNHNRGTSFYNFNHLINQKLVAAFDKASKTLHEFYFGRFDVRCSSFEEMEKGNFKIIEVNGVNSEPAHIYDPTMSLVKAYRDLFRHWNTIYKISMENKKRGNKPMKISKMYTAIVQHLQEKKLHPNKIYEG